MARFAVYDPHRGPATVKWAIDDRAKKAKMAQAKLTWNSVTACVPTPGPGGPVM